MRNIGQVFKRKNLAIALTSALAMSVVSLANADSESFDIDIKAQKAGTALMSLGQNTGVQVVFSGKIGRDIDVPAISGQYTLSAALDQMLEGTGLQYEFVSDNSVLIKADENATGQNGQDGEKEVDEELIVTGSRLRSSTPSGSNVFIITREDIKRQGFGNVEDVIRSLPQNFSNINSAAALDNSLNSVDAQGQSAANLRGLGAGSTLILVNGRRWVQASSFGNGTVNLNGIPFSAIERIDVLLDGASAVYGADAVGGVINFILRENFDGGETIARYEASRYGGGTYRLEQNASVGWESGKALLTLSYSETDSVDDTKLLDSFDFRPLGGSDQRVTFFGQPGIVGSFFAPIGALPADDDGTNGLAALSPANIVPFDDVNARSTTSNSDSLSVRLSVDQDLFEGFNLFGEIFYTRNESNRVLGPTSLSPFSTIVPASNPYNDLGFDVPVGYIFKAETEAGLLPPGSFLNDQKILTYTLGFDAELPFEGWTADFSATRSEEDGSFGSINLNADLLAERLAGVDSNGNPLPIEQVINPFGNGSAQNPEALADLVGLVMDGGFGANTNTAKQDSFLLSFQGGLFELPAGEVGLVLGTEYRTETLDYSTDPSRGNLFLVLEPERDIESYFTEIGVPVVAENNNLPGVQSLDLKIAVRHDTYTFEGPFDGDNQPFVSKEFSSTSPKVDLAWQVVPELKIRASWGESFRPPTSSRLFSTTGGPFNFIAVIDPENPGDGVQFPEAFSGGNPDLQPEISDSVSYGFDWTPSGVLEGLSFSATYTDLDIQGLISSGFTIAFDAPEVLFEIPGLVERDGDGNISRINLLPVNVSQRLSETVDATVRYDFDTDFGSFQLGLNGTYVSSLQDIFIAGAEPEFQDGTSSGPERIKARGSVSWSRDNVSANIYANYSSSYNHDTFIDGPVTERIHHYVTFDLNGTYDMVETGWRFNGGIRNLFNRSFPFFNGFGKPWDPQRVDTRGRIVYLEVSKSYDIF